MAERKRIEKDTLIKILVCCIDDDCSHCPNAYKYGDIEVCEVLARGFVTIPIAIMRETIKALKDQEALPIVYETNEYTGLPIAHCPSCGEDLEQFHSGVYGKETQFCYYCGQKVKWVD